MSWPSVTRDRFHGFKPKQETDFSKFFYKNVKPEGIDRFKSMLLNQDQYWRSQDTKKSLSIAKENHVKNSLNTRSKIYGESHNRNNDQVYKSQYEIYTLLNISGRQHSGV